MEYIIRDVDLPSNFDKSRLEVVIRCEGCEYYDPMNPVTGMTRCRKLRIYGLFGPSGHCSNGRRR